MSAGSRGSIPNSVSCHSELGCGLNFGTEDYSAPKRNAHIRMTLTLWGARRAMAALLHFFADFKRRRPREHEFFHGRRT